MDDVKEVSVTVLSIVGVVKTAQNRCNYLDSEIYRHFAVLFLQFFNDRAKILAENIFHRNEILIVEFPEIVNFYDIFMAYVADNPGLGKEHLHKRRVVPVLFQHFFDGNRHRIDR